MTSSPPDTSLSTPLSEWDERTLSETSLKIAQEKLQSLCATHAATFVAVERRGSQLTQALQSLVSSLDTAIPLIAAAEHSLSEEKCDENVAGGCGSSTTTSSLTALTEAHKVRRRTLLQHSSLLELLELPPLLQACIRGQWYTEALDLCSLSNTLERRHGSNAIVGQVVEELRHGQFELRKCLLGRWSGPVTLPDCLEVVTALRRLNAIELEDGTRGRTVQELDVIHDQREYQLQLQFLEARDVWLTSIKVETRKMGSEPLLDLIDIYRTRCFEIATQFVTLFSTNNNASTTSISSSTCSSTSSTTQAPLILSLWLTRRIHTFLHSHLSSHMAHISDAAQIRDVYDAATFFATSLGRIGGDFSPLLPQLMEPALVNMVTGHWNDGVTAFTHVLTTCREAGVVGPLYSVNAATGTVFEEVVAQDAEVVDANLKTPAPPRQLLTYPPLARLVNAFLIGLNELRRCLFPAVFPTLRKSFAEFLVGIQSALEQYERAVLTPGFARRGEEYQRLRDLAVELKEEYDGCMRPYMMVALEVAFGAFENVKLLEQEQKKDDLIGEDEKEDNEEEEEVVEKEDNEEEKEVVEKEDNEEEEEVVEKEVEAVEKYPVTEGDEKNEEKVEYIDEETKELDKGIQELSTKEDASLDGLLSTSIDETET